MSEEVAKLYSEAQLPGTSYWDFSASRKQVQGKFRDHIERDSSKRAVVENAGTSPQHVDEPGHGSRSASASGEISPLRPPVLKGGLPAATLPVRLGPGLHAFPKPHPQGSPSESMAVMEAAGRWSPAPPAFDSQHRTVEPQSALPPGFAQRPPTLAVCSLVGGVGKTSLVANLGRALSAIGEHVLLTDTALGGLLPLYFGSRESKPGILRTFSPPGPVRLETQVAVQLLNLEVERYPRHENGSDWLLSKVVQAGRGASRVLIDVATASREASRLLWLRPTILVPILPDVNSIASLQSIESLLGQPGTDGVSAQIFFLLNQFDFSSALHRDLREMLHLRLGERLLQFVIRANPWVSEAAAAGMTVMDYAPDSTIADDYRHLANWLARTVPPALSSGRGSRWREQ